jgi:hypothetical protein
MRISLPPLPFPQLWWALLGTAAAFAFGLCLLQIVQPSSLMESVVGETGEEASAKTQAAVGMFHSLYHMISAFMGGDDYGWATNAERVLRVAMLIIALVGGATYTANLVRTSGFRRLEGETPFLSLSLLSGCRDPPLTHQPRRCVEFLRAGGIPLYPQLHRLRPVGALPSLAFRALSDAPHALSPEWPFGALRPVVRV